MRTELTNQSLKRRLLQRVFFISKQRIWVIFHGVLVVATNYWNCLGFARFIGSSEFRIILNLRNNNSTKVYRIRFFFSIKHLMHHCQLFTSCTMSVYMFVSTLPQSTSRLSSVFLFSFLSFLPSFLPSFFLSFFLSTRLSVNWHVHTFFMHLS